jgi:hypothetical protein
LRTKSTSDGLENGNEPPPLPEKERRPSITNSQDFFTSTPKSGLSWWRKPEYPEKITGEMKELIYEQQVTLI